jgi:hypothetical protein
MKNTSQYKKILTGAVLVATALGSVGLVNTESANAAALIGDVSVAGALRFNANSFDFTAPVGVSTASPNVDGQALFSSAAGLTSGLGSIKDLCNPTFFVCGNGATGSPIIATPLAVNDFLTFNDNVNGGLGSFRLESISMPAFANAVNGVSVGFGVEGTFFSSLNEASKGSGLFTTQLATGSLPPGARTAETLPGFLAANPTTFLFSTESASLTLSAVPEPGSILGSALFATLGAGVLIKKRRSNKKLQTA